MKKTFLGVALGAVAGVIDVIPMVFQNLTWDANISAFCLWVASGFLIATSNLKIKSYFKGIIVSLAVLWPSAVLIGWKEPESLVPVLAMTLILGAALGFAVEKYGK